MRKQKFMVLLALLAVFVGAISLAACGSSHSGSHDDKHPATMMGEWHQINANSDGWLTASISGSSIQVNLRSRDSSSIFWMGSFETSQLNHPSGKFKVVSLGDQDAMKWDITASTEQQKTFTYDHGVLSFQFSALGSSTIVHLKQTKTHIPTYTRTVKPTATSSKASTLRILPHHQDVEGQGDPEGHARQEEVGTTP